MYLPKSTEEQERKGRKRGEEKGEDSKKDRINGQFPSKIIVSYY